MSRIVIINPETLFRNSLRKIVEREGTHQIVGEGSYFTDIPSLNSIGHPEIILLENEPNNPEWFKAVSEFTTMRSLVKVAILTKNSQTEFIHSALNSGVRSILHSSMDSEEVLNALHTISAGGSYFYNKVLDYFIEVLKNKEPAAEKQIIQRERILPLHLLTMRECEVLQLLAEGHNNDRIGDILGITSTTARNHVSKILLKMKVTNRTNAVIQAFNKGWVKMT